MANGEQRGSGCWWAAGCAGLVGLGVLVGVGVWGGGILLTRNSEVYRRAQGAVLADPYIEALVGADPHLVRDWLPDGEIVETDGGGTATFRFLVEGATGSLQVETRALKNDEGWSIQRILADSESGLEPVAEIAASKGISLGDSSGTVTAGSVASGGARAAQLVVEGRAAYDQNRDLEAMQKFDLALELDRASAEAYHWRGRTKGRSGDNVGALSDLGRAVELDPKNAGAWEALAWVRARGGQDFEAIEALNAYLALKPGDAKALADRATAEFHVNRIEAARADARASCDAGYAMGCTTLDRIEKVR